MNNQIIELLHIINKKIDKIDNSNIILNTKVDNVIDRLNDLEKDINNKTSISSSSNEYLSVKEIVEVYKISKEKIYQDIKSKEFTQNYSQKKRGGKILIKKRDWDLWFSSLVIPEKLEKLRKKKKSKLKSKKLKKKSKKQKIIKNQDKIILSF